jgi:hypothetical protein
VIPRNRAWPRGVLSAAHIGIVTVHQLEAGLTQPRRVTVDVVRRAFETTGVEFIDEGAVRVRNMPIFDLDRPRNGGIRDGVAPRWGHPRRFRADFGILPTSISLSRREITDDVLPFEIAAAARGEAAEQLPSSATLQGSYRKCDRGGRIRFVEDRPRGEQRCRIRLSSLSMHSQEKGEPLLLKGADFVHINAKSHSINEI